jgi:hypothetical protein
MLVAHEGGAVRASLDANTGPGVELVGDLVDKRGGTGHGSIVLVPDDGRLRVAATPTA